MKEWMAGTSPAMTGFIEPSFCRRAGPWPLRAAQAFERLRHAKHAVIVEAAADDLHADRKSAFAKAAIDRHGRIFRHVPRHGVADMLERFCGIVYPGSEFGREIHHPRHRRNQVSEIGGHV